MAGARKVYTVFSLFTGGGGFDLGFHEAGFKIIGASDIWIESEKTMRHNFPKIPFLLGDIRTVTAQQILKLTDGIRPDVIIGGPPCQGFSVMGDKNSADPRNTLFESYVRLVEDLRPKCFVFENVKGLQSMFGGRYLRMVSNSFAAIGYDVHLKLLNAKDFGVPQSRERVIIFGTHLAKPFNYPEATSEGVGKLSAKKTVKDAIWDLRSKGEEIPNHIALSHGDIVVRRYQLIPEGGKLPPPNELPKDIRRGNFGNTYVRLHRGRPATTMVPGNNAFPIHPVLDRSLTPREAARIQSFPDKFFFSGPRKEQCKLVGNAVPPLMAAHIAVAVKSHLSGKAVGPSKNLLLPRNECLAVEVRNGKEKAAPRLKFVDLFAGAGGIGLGFAKAGFEQLFSADFDKSVAKTHRHNHHGVPFFEGDLSDDGVFDRIKGEYRGESVDVIVGGPPCQGFSIFGKRRFLSSADYDPHNDSRNRLVFTFLRYVKALNPKWFFMENVPGITSLDNGWFLRELIKDIERLGYLNHGLKIINTADYGVPQARRRFILIANRTGHVIPWPKPKYFEHPEEWQLPFRTVGEVLTGLDGQASYSKYFNHSPMKHAPSVMERFSYIEEGQKLDPSVLPRHLQFSKSGKKIQSFSKVFFRLDRNAPSPTLVPGHSAFPIHPWLDRQITVREAARIQTFPDDLEFLGAQGEQCKQVGNAFPPLAAETFANLIDKATSNNWRGDDVSNLAYYSLIQR